MEVIRARAEYLQDLLAEITAIKERGGTTLYRINDWVMSGPVTYITNYFKSQPGYTIETKRCIRCSNQWDIIITWTPEG
jgi:hypothetical protein